MESSRRLCVNRWDVIVVGSGVAGLCAAIGFAEAGRSVLLMERSTGLVSRPGETLHPGVEPIFNQLGIGVQAAAAASCRHPGIFVNTGSGQELVSYGRGWCGYQIKRLDLNRILLNRLRTLGGTVSFTCGAINILDHQLNEWIVSTKDGCVTTRWLIDATGAAGWFDRRMGTKMQIDSDPIWLRYGYRKSVIADGRIPTLVFTQGSWCWNAPLGNGEIAWVDASETPFSPSYPSSKGADGTWKVSKEPAVKGCFRVGDAALRLDPSIGHGVLRAMMSAILAVQLVVSVDNGKIEEHVAVDAYNSWIRHWFEEDAKKMRGLKISLRISQLGAKNKINRPLRGLI